MSECYMSDDMTQQSIHLHERVGRLEQEVHTLSHRADSMEHIPPRVNTIEAHIASMQTEGRATRSTVEKMDAEMRMLSINQTRGFTSVKTTIWIVFTAVPAVIAAAFAYWKMTYEDNVYRTPDSAVHAPGGRDTNVGAADYSAGRYALEPHDGAGQVRAELR